MRVTLILLSVVAAAVGAFAAAPEVEKKLVAPVGKPTELTVKVEAGKKLGFADTFKM
ncbi:hypothetical protein IAI36_11750, partial [Streptococcus pseudopneumoniae]|nr:hypothetical protein [Streptococcus pseudopneumoniae]